MDQIYGVRGRDRAFGCAITSDDGPLFPRVDVDLFGANEFRSGIEVAYHLENGMRLGLGWDHLSNLDIYARNPCVEMVHLRQPIPLD